MTRLKKLGFMALLAAVVIVGAEVGSELEIPGVKSVIQDADARIGRPLTPVSVAGVARRTVRRCAVGVYRC